MKASPQQRPGAISAVWPAAIASGALVAQHVAGKATRDALFLTQFGLGLLPAAMIGAALVSAIAVLGISRAIGKYGPARVVQALFACSAALFLIEWKLSLESERAAAVAVYAHTAVFGSAAMSAFWSSVNERFDPHVAKKIVGQIASGGTLGGIVGGVVVWRASSHLSLPTMLALLSLVNLVGLGGAVRMARGARGAGLAEEPLARGGWKIVRETSYLRDLALLVLAGAVIQALLDWLLSAHATHTYGDGAQLLGFFALFNTVVGVLSFVAQTSLSRPLLERRGLVGTLQSQPISVALFAAVALLAPQLWTVVLLRGGEAVTRNSLYRSAYELFYTPLPTAKKRATKTLIDVGVDRVGTLLASAGLLAVVHLDHDSATRVVLAFAMVLAGLAWLVSARLHDGYVSALAASLRSGAIALGEDGAKDLTTRTTLAETTAFLDRERLLEGIEELQKTKRAEGASAKATTLPSTAGAPEPAEPPPVATSDVTADALLALAAQLQSRDKSVVKAALSASLSGPLVAFAIPLLANDAVVRDALRALRKCAPKATGQLVDALLDQDVDVRIRRRIPRVLKACPGERAAAGLLLGLSDPAFEVRAQAALALTYLRGEGQVFRAEEQVFDAALRELEAEPLATASQATDEDERRLHLDHVFALLGLAVDREPLRIAYRAMRSDETRLRGTALEYLEVTLPARVRDALLPLLGEPKPAPKPSQASPSRSGS